METNKTLHLTSGSLSSSEEICNLFFPKLATSQSPCEGSISLDLVGGSKWTYRNFFQRKFSEWLQILNQDIWGGGRERHFAEESSNSETKWREIIFHFHFSDTKVRVFKRVQEMESVSLSLRHFSQQDDQYWNYEEVWSASKTTLSRKFVLPKHNLLSLIRTYHFFLFTRFVFMLFFITMHDKVI